MRHLNPISESGSITRPLVLPTSEPATSAPIQITLFDALPDEPSAVGLQSWGSSILLARMIALNPAEFGVRTTGRVLELGAGTGLLSTAWRALADRLLAEETVVAPQGDGPAPLVVATDFHNSVLANLRKNVADNAPATADAPLNTTTARRTCALSVHKLDWSAVHGSRSFALSSKQSLHMPAPFDKPFDIILGADIGESRGSSHSFPS